MLGKSAYVDSFARDNLPPVSLWPALDLSKNPALKYPAQLNCASELLDLALIRGHAERPLFYTSRDRWNYRDLLIRSNKIAQVLVEDFGFVPGQRVLLRGPNSPMLAACWFAVLKAGGICVTTMPLLRSAELSFIVEKAKVDIALCDAKWVDELETAKNVAPVLKRILCYENSPSQRSGRQSLEELMVEKDGAFSNIKTSADDVALIAFTSGTTGKAKATMHFHRDVMAICDSFPRSILMPNSSDVFCGTPPFAFTFGLGGLLLFPMRFGASVVLLEKAPPEELVAAIEEFKATICFSSPTGYRGMLPSISKFNISSLKKCVSAGEVLPLATFKAWEKATGIQPIDGIGATELLHIFISASGDDIRPGSTGRAIPGYEAKVVDHEGNLVAPGEVGLLAVRGPTGCRYLDDVERQKEYVRDGWNYTGDAYRMDKEGYFWYEARADDMIISAGYNIAGPEVENALLLHPKVKECGVVAAPDPERGHIVKAFIVLHDVKEASPEIAKVLQDHVKAQIAPYKYPRAIEFVEALPRTETGKLQRFRLRQVSR